MRGHKRFDFASIDDLAAECDSLGLDLPLSEDVSVLGQLFALNGAVIPNRLAVQPMEGCDGDDSGHPGELTRRRYRRFASGGSGLLWFEAAAVVPEGRANPRQLMMRPETIETICRMRTDALESAKASIGSDHEPYTVIQLTHSGRYSRPVDEPSPIIAVENRVLGVKNAENVHVITDRELDALKNAYVEAAVAAKEAGFDAVDIKSCHRYLISELLSARGREGRYGGCFENRTRFLLDVVERIQARDDTPSVTCRLNVYDALPYDVGWGVDESDFHRPDLTEPLRLVRLLAEAGVGMIDVTAGNPYYNPHVNRPYDIGPYVSVEHPLTGVARMLGFAREVKRVAPDVAVVASGFSWLREFGANVAAGCIDGGWFDIAGFGRQAFAYPGYAYDIVSGGGMKREKCCIACGKCSELMRYGSTAGCVVRDADTYAPIYREARKGKLGLVGKHEAEHV